MIVILLLRTRPHNWQLPGVFLLCVPKSPPSSILWCHCIHCMLDAVYSVQLLRQINHCYVEEKGWDHRPLQHALVGQPEHVTAGPPSLWSQSCLWRRPRYSCGSFFHIFRWSDSVASWLILSKAPLRSKAVTTCSPYFGTLLRTSLMKSNMSCIDSLDWNTNIVCGMMSLSSR